MGVRSVEELVSYADASGKAELDMKEVALIHCKVHEYAELIVCKNHSSSEDLAKFAPMQVSIFLVCCPLTSTLVPSIWYVCST